MSSASLNIPSECYSQFDHHIKCVLNSGLLLDEDIEALDSNYTFNYENAVESNRSYILVGLTMTSAAATFYLAKQNYPAVLSAACASLGAVITTLQIKKCFMKRRRKRRIKEIVENLRNILKLNRMVLNYLKQRKGLGTDQSIDPYTKKIEELMTTLLKNEISLLLLLIETINHCCTKIPALHSQYVYLNDIDFNQFDTSSLTNIDDCITYQQKFSDIFILVVSNSLACLSLMFCPSLWNKILDVNEILNDILSKIQEISRNCYEKTSKKFDETKFNLVKNREAKIKIKSFDNFVTSKLHNSLLNSMMHTSIVLEKSQIIFEKLQKVDLSNRGQKKEVAQHILELRDYALDYYEALDILCKLYEVTVKNPAKSERNLNQIEAESADVTRETLEVSQLNLNEPLEDEEYEMYIGEDDPSGSGYSFNYRDEEESMRFASLMTQELKHSLKTHSRFLAARQKRGIVDEPPKEEQPLDVSEVSLEITSKVTPAAPPLPPPLLLEDNKLVPDATPPPPPPLPKQDNSIQRDDAEEENSFLNSIKNLSTARKIVEDVFEDDC